ncbi:MAG: hypothetical protein Q9157_001426 [Trypethelium eluteriae]
MESAWELALCHFLEFGTPQNLQLAAEFAKKAQGYDQILTSLTTVLIPDSLQNTCNTEWYNSIVVSAFCTTPSLVRDKSISFNLGNIKSKQIRFPNYTEFSSWILSNSERLDLSTRSVWINDLDKPLDVADTLILFRDLSLLMTLSTKLSSKSRRNLDAAGLAPNSNQTPLVHAIRTGLVGAALALLKQGESPQARCIDGTNAFHWLFLLGDSVRSFTREKLTPYIDDPALHAPSHTVNVLHKQWPLQLLGTPIAFAIASRSKDAVLALLELGADPKALVYHLGQFGETDHRSHWNSLHLAIKYHLPDVLDVLLGYLSSGFPKSSVPYACALSFSSPVERRAIHGKDQKKNLMDTIRKIQDTKDTLAQAVGFQAKQKLRFATSSGVSPLMQAIDFNDTAVVSALVEADPLLAEHVLGGPQDKQKIIKESGQSGLQAVDSGHRSPLHLAVTGPYDCASQYILREAPELLHSRDLGGKTALLISHSASNSEWLLSRGADIEVLDNEGRSALHWACLHEALDVVQVLLRYEASVNCQSLMWGTPLHCAILKKNREIAMALLQYGAAVNARDYVGNTPFNMAVHSSRKDIARLLLQYGAEVTIANDLDETPIAAAIESGDFAAVQAIAPLIRADSIVKPSELETPLHMCARSGDVEMMKLFLQKPAASVSLEGNIDGRSPFLLTAMCAHVEAGRLLLDAGLADVREKDRFGLTAFHLVLLDSWNVIRSSGEQRLSFCSLLREFDAPMSERDQHGRTPWDIALHDFLKNVNENRPASTEFLVFLLEYGEPQACQTSAKVAKTAEVTALLYRAITLEDAPLFAAFIRAHAVQETDIEIMIRRHKRVKLSEDKFAKQFASALFRCALNNHPASQMTSWYLRMDTDEFAASALEWHPVDINA